MTMKERLVSAKAMKATKSTPTSRMNCLMGCMESLYTMTMSKMRAVKMDNNIKTTVVDSRRGARF